MYFQVYLFSTKFAFLTFLSDVIIIVFFIMRVNNQIIDSDNPTMIQN